MRVFLMIMMVVWPLGVMAEDRLVRLYAPVDLVESGLMRHILPRFSLKTQVRVDLVETTDTADIILGPVGRALFQSDETIWHMNVIAGDHPGTLRLTEWLLGDVGKRTIFGFAPDGVPLFTPPAEAVLRTVEIVIDGDPVLGHTVAQAKCGRCHAVDEAGKMNSIGSTPSFFVLRSLENWQDRFMTFYVLNPHPAFTQIATITQPFAQNLPPPIVPVEMTLNQLQAVLAYVGTLKAADLGAPLEHQ